MSLKIGVANCAYAETGTTTALVDRRNLGTEYEEETPLCSYIRAPFFLRKSLFAYWLIALS
jgi:hypothetical protein